MKKRHFCTFAILLCLITLFTTFASSLYGVIAAALNGENDLRPLETYEYIGWWELYKGGTRVGQQLSLYNKSTWNADVVQDAYIIMNEVDLSTQNKDAIAADLVANYSVKTEKNNTNLPITAATYNTRLSTENSVWVFTLTINNNNDTFLWNNYSGTLIFNVAVVDVNNGPKTVTGVNEWQVVSVNGGVDSKTVYGEANTVDIDYAIYDSEVLTYGSVIVENYKVRVAGGGKEDRYDIIEAIYDANGSTRTVAKYQLVLKDRFHWSSGNSVSFNVRFNIKYAAALQGIIDWKLAAADGSTTISGGQGDTVTFNERPADDAALAEVIQKIISSYRIVARYDNGTTVEDVTYNIAELVSVTDAGRYITYKIVLDGTPDPDTLEWKETGDPVVLYLTINVGTEPLDVTGITNWRILFKSNLEQIGERWDRGKTIDLPDRVADDDREAYGEKLKERYYLSLKINGTYEPNGDIYQNIVEVLSFVYDPSKDTATTFSYKVEPRDNLYWNGSSDIMELYVTVKRMGAPAERYENVYQWQVMGYYQVRNTGLTIILNNVNYDEDVMGKEVSYAEVLKAKYTEIRVQENGVWHYSAIKDIVYDEVKSAEYTNSVRNVAAYKIIVYDEFYDKDTKKLVEFYVAISGTADFGDLNSITVPSKEPQGLSMNIFDYWTVTDDPTDEGGNPWYPVFDWEVTDKLIDEKYNGGINGGHALKFFRTSPTKGYEGTPEQIASYGVWNHSTINVRENVKGIVRNLLVNGYPKLALDTVTLGDLWSNFAASTATNLREDISGVRDESLDYLFNPNVDHIGKASYKNVKGLFQLNNQGYYYYDSKLNFAQFDRLSNDFLLYNTWGVIPAGDSPHGQFFPFNDANEVFKDVSDEENDEGQRTLTQFEGIEVDSRSDIMNHHFGFTMKVDFQQPINGQVNHRIESLAEDMVFKFAGDDDCWVFVDGVLVLDLGGVHSGLYGEINFATGEVKTGLMNYDINEGVEMSGQPFEVTTLYDLFDKAGVANDDDLAWGTGAYNKTFAFDTLHTIQLFYMERGHWDSNLAVYFNLQPRVPHKIYKVDEDGNPLSDAVFAIYAAEPNATFKENETYHTASEFDKVNPYFKANKPESADNVKKPPEGVEIEPITQDLFTTDQTGYVTLGGIDFAMRFSSDGNKYYILEEVDPPDGARRLMTPIVVEYGIAGSETLNSNPGSADANEENEKLYKGVFTVLNQYETGAYASFSAILEDNASEMYYASTTISKDDQGNTTFDITRTTSEIQGAHQDSALLFAVPMIYTDIGEGMNWYPIYGSNTAGYRIVDIYQPEEYADHPNSDNGGKEIDSVSDPEQLSYRWALRHNLLAAAMRQVSDEIGPDWYFRYETILNANGDEAYSRFIAELNNLPGDASRYLINNKDVTEYDVAGVDLRLIGVLVDAEALTALLGYVDENGNIDADALASIKKMSDEEKYLALQNHLVEQNFEAHWNETYENDNQWIRDWLDVAYVQRGAENTSRDRGVNLADINTFTRYYGSVFYIPNERRELRVLKQDTNGNALPNAEFGLYESFNDAVDLNNAVATGITDENGLLIFSIDPDHDEEKNVIPGHATVDWNMVANDSIFWVREINAPGGYVKNEAIVQVYVGELTIYANASAYRAQKNGNDYVTNDGNYVPVLIDDIIGQSADKWQAGGINSDGVEVWASTGKLFQSMEKFADTLLNSTLLDIDAYDYLFVPNHVDEFRDPEDSRYASSWQNMSGDNPVSMHFWDQELQYASSEYSDNHDLPEGYTFSVTENGYLWMRPVQSSEEDFKAHHGDDDSIYNSRRDVLLLNDKKTPVDISRVFSPVNVIVIHNDYSGPHMTIEKDQSRNDGERTTDKLEVIGNDFVTYYLTVKSDGNDTAENVVVTDVVPEGLELVQGSISHNGTFDESNRKITWNLGDIVNGESVTVSFQVTVPYVDKVTTWVNVGSLKYSNNPDGDDEIPSNEVVIEERAYDLSVKKEISGTDDDLNTMWRFTLVVTLPEGANTEYKYVIKDRDGKETEGTCTLGEDNVFEFELGHMYTITIFGLPAGIQYKVDEDLADKDGWTKTDSGNTEGELESDTEVVFKNTSSATTPPDPEGSLKVEKQTTDKSNDTEFTFKVTITLPEGTETFGTYTYDGKVNGTLKFTKDTESDVFTCELEFKLKHGEYVTFSNLPLGTKYTVEETELGEYVLARIDTAPESESTVINRDRKMVSGVIESAEEEYSVTYVNAKTVDIPGSGGTGSMTLYLSGVALIAVAGIYLAFTKRKGAVH